MGNWDERTVTALTILANLDAHNQKDIILLAFWLGMHQYEDSDTLARLLSGGPLESVTSHNIQWMKELAAETLRAIERIQRGG